jgi:hypothetical protein
MTQGALIQPWQDARLFAVVAGVGWFAWRRGGVGPSWAGMMVYLPLKIGLGW